MNTGQLWRAPAEVLCAVIRGYQRLTAARPPACRYWPSCSHYAIEALESHGVAGGSWLVFRRLMRCHPFGGHGVDPVPPARTNGSRA